MSTQFRAKIAINEVKKTAWAETIVASPVYSGDKNSEDNTFSSATPSGNIELCVSNKDLWGKINPGDVFYVDFTPVAPTPAN